MPLVELWYKYQKSGIDGNPIITDKELKDLSNKLDEMMDFFKLPQVINIGLISMKSGIDNVIWARKNKR